MRIIKYGLLALSSLIYTNNASAGFGGASTVLGYDIGDSGALMVRLSATHECGGDIVMVSNATAYFKDMLSTVMMAYTTKEPIYVYVSSCTGAVGTMVRIQIGHVYY